VDLSELANGLLIHDADLIDEGQTSQKDGMSSLVQDGLDLLDKVLMKLGHLANHTNSTKSGLLAHIGVGIREEPLNLRAEIPSHFRGWNVGKGGQSKTHNVDVGMVQVTKFMTRKEEEKKKGSRKRKIKNKIKRNVNVLLEGVGDKGEDFLVLIQKEHDSKVAKPLISEARRRDQLHTLHLTKLGWIPEHVDIQELGDIPVTVVSIALLEGSSNGGGFLGHNFALFIGSLSKKEKEKEKEKDIKKIE
jgi:hypothetical protein